MRLTSILRDNQVRILAFYVIIFHVLRISPGEIRFFSIHPLFERVAGLLLALLVTHGAGPADGLAPQLGVEVSV